MRILGTWLAGAALLGLCACSSTRTQTATMAPAASSAPSESRPMAADAAAAGKKVDCSLVRCAACPEGQTPALTPPDCCRCVPVGDRSNQGGDCSDVRCGDCPAGEHPSLTPPDCCKCVPGMKEAALPF